MPGWQAGCCAVRQACTARHGAICAGRTAAQQQQQPGPRLRATGWCMPAMPPCHSSKHPHARQPAAAGPSPGAHLHDAVQGVEGQARKGAHLVALVVLVVDDVQPAAQGEKEAHGSECWSMSSRMGWQHEHSNAWRCRHAFRFAAMLHVDIMPCHVMPCHVMPCHAAQRHCPCPHL